MCNNNAAKWLLLLSACASYLMTLVEAASYITLDCGLVGDSECERMQSLMQGNGTTVDAKSMHTSKGLDSGTIIAIVIGTLVACTLVVVGVVIWMRKRKQRRNAEHQNQEVVIVNATAASEEWEASTINSPTSILLDKASGSYPQEEEVLFRLEVLDDCLTPPANPQYSSHKAQ